jgi:hypothetical protein
LVLLASFVRLMRYGIRDQRNAQGRRYKAWSLSAIRVIRPARNGRSPDGVGCRKGRSLYTPWVGRAQANAVRALQMRSPCSEARKSGLDDVEGCFCGMLGQCQALNLSDGNGRAYREVVPHPWTWRSGYFGAQTDANGVPAWLAVASTRLQLQNELPLPCLRDARWTLCLGSSRSSFPVCCSRGKGSEIRSNVGAWVS